MSSYKAYFDLQAQIAEWMVQVAFKHMPLDPDDHKQFNRIITDARFHETVLYLQQEEEDNERATS